jgi:hypothetical protein
VIRLLILTGARLREILHARWEFIDFERGVIFLPDSKTGKKPIYLSAAALAVLSTLPHLEGNPHIIPGDRTGQPRVDLKRPWTAVTKAARLEGLRIHDLRHSFASIGAGASLGLPIIGKLLGHSQPSTTARYAHLDADPMRRAVKAGHRTRLPRSSLRAPAETHIKIISSDFVASTPELARHAITRLRALRLWMPWRRPRPKQRELAPRSISFKIGITSPMILRRPRKNWSCRKSESETQKTLKFSSVTSRPPTSAIHSHRIGSWGGMQNQAALPRVQASSSTLALAS